MIFLSTCIGGLLTKYWRHIDNVFAQYWFAEYNGKWNFVHFFFCRLELCNNLTINKEWHVHPRLAKKLLSAKQRRKKPVKAPTTVSRYCNNMEHMHDPLWARCFNIVVIICNVLARKGWENGTKRFTPFSVRPVTFSEYVRPFSSPFFAEFFN